MPGTIRVASFRIDYAATIDGSAQVTSAMTEVAYTPDKPIQVNAVAVTVDTVQHSPVQLNALAVTLLVRVDPPNLGIEQLRGPTSPQNIQDNQQVKGPADN